MQEKEKRTGRRLKKPEAEVVDLDPQKPIVGGKSKPTQTQLKEQAGASCYAKVAIKSLMVTIYVTRRTG